MPEYARSRFMLVWLNAITLPTIIVTIASAQMSPNQREDTVAKVKLNTRMNAANTAALVVTDMKAVIGVGAPSYTSGVHMWNGTTETLNANPTAISPMPT